MPTRSTVDQIAFRYRQADSTTGVTRDTAKRIAERLGVDETQAIHLALHDLAIKLLPQYEADDGPLWIETAWEKLVKGEGGGGEGGEKGE